MNCVLWGAEVAHLLWEGKLLQQYPKYREQAREKLAELTSELTPEEVEYLLGRIEDQLQ